jgi:DNA-binding transcriptional regulator YdaS (Cro superfamily)
MTSSGSIIDALGGTGKVAERLGLWESTVSGWRTRGIPPARWPELVRLASEIGVDGISFEALADLTASSDAEARA